MLEGKNYKILKQNIAAHELIGLYAEVVAGTEKSRIGLKGCIVDETKNLLVIETKNGIKKIPKKESVFEIMLGKEKVKLDGGKILARPEDRIKFMRRNRNG